MQNAFATQITGIAQQQIDLDQTLKEIRESSDAQVQANQATLIHELDTLKQAFDNMKRVCEDTRLHAESGRTELKIGNTYADGGDAYAGVLNVTAEERSSTQVKMVIGNTSAFTDGTALAGWVNMSAPGEIVETSSTSKKPEYLILNISDTQAKNSGLAVSGIANGLTFSRINKKSTGSE